MPAPALNSSSAFREAFANGLQTMLREHRELGVYILVLANAGFDSPLLERLQAELDNAFHDLAQAFRQSAEKASSLGAPDDVGVFGKLLEAGSDLRINTRFRTVGDWELQFNPLRALRPARNAGAMEPGIFRPFDSSGFNFAKPFLQKECFWKGELMGRACDLLYNKFPFARLHGLLVPEPGVGNAQFLTPEMIDWVWQAMETLGEGIPEMAMGYNSLGAYASVNHLHFQSFVDERPMPVERVCWRHNGGERDYPLDCLRLESGRELQELLADWHANTINYNLLFRPGRVWCLPRARQGLVGLPGWTGGFAWSEVCGAFACFDEQAYDTLDESQLTRRLEAFRLVGNLAWR